MSDYFDHAATTPLHPKVKDVMIASFDDFGNPSSIHGFGRTSHHHIMEARDVIAQSIGAKKEEIIFTASGSEGDNMAIRQGVLLNREKGNHIITTQIEHPAVLNTMKDLEREGYNVTYLPVDQYGHISLSDFDEALCEETILVSIMYGNNEVGSLMPIQEIGQRLAGHHALFHTDAVQAYGTEDIDVTELGVDLLSVAAHKVNGPKGIGFLYVNQAVHLPALITGGEQEYHRRAGTENTPAIMGFQAAVEQLTAEEKQHRRDQYKAYKRHILHRLNEAGVDVEVNGSLEGLPHILNIWVKKNSQIVQTRLDMTGIAVSTGSACTAGTVDPSHVLLAMYGDSPRVMESIRISFGLYTTEESVDRLIDALIQILK